MLIWMIRTLNYYHHVITKITHYTCTVFIAYNSSIVMRLNPQCMLEGEDRYWLLVMRNVSCVEKLVTSVSALWKMAFQTDLPIIHK